MEIGLLGELFLGQLYPLSMLADSCTQNSAIIRGRRHHDTKQQITKTLYTAKRMLFFFSSCVIYRLFDRNIKTR